MITKVFIYNSVIFAKRLLDNQGIFDTITLVIAGRSIEEVITSSTRNRVGVMSATWVRIPPPPPRREGLRDHNPVRESGRDFLLLRHRSFPQKVTLAALARL